MFCFFLRRSERKGEREREKGERERRVKGEERENGGRDGEQQGSPLRHINRYYNITDVTYAKLIRRYWNSRTHEIMMNIK